MVGYRSCVLLWWGVASLLLGACSLITAPNGTPTEQATATLTLQPPRIATQTRTLAPTVNSTATPEPPLSGTVSLWHSGSQAEQQALLDVIKAFRERHPLVLFDVLHVPFEDLRPRFEMANQRGGGPALLLGPGEWGAALYDTGMIADLTDLVSPDLPGKLNQPAVEAMRYQGALIGLPYSLEGVVLYRNRGIIPRPAAEYEELVAAAQAATQGDQIGAVLERSFYFSGAHLNGLGGSMMGADGAPAFADELGIAWVNLLLSFEQAGPAEYGSDTDLNLFMEGRVGVIIDGTWNRAVISDTIGLANLAIDAWPFHQDGHLSGYVRSEVVFLSARARPVDLPALAAFVDFFLSLEGQAILGEAGYIPAAPDAPVDDRLISQAMIALADGTSYPITPLMSAYTVSLEAALRSVFFEGVPPIDALQRAQDEILQTIQTP